MTLTRDLVWLLGEIGAVAHLLIASAVTFHVLMYKRNVGAAMAWMGVAWLSPFVGGALYFAFGINRVRRRALRLRNERSKLFTAEEAVPAVDLLDHDLGGDLVDDRGLRQEAGQRQSAADPYRFARISEVLGSGRKFTVGEMARLQTDLGVKINTQAARVATGGSADGN